MGMFDDLVCEHPLPGPSGDNKVWQTKDTPAQYLDTYTITADGRLVHTRSNLGEEPGGFCERFIGEVRFYSSWDQKGPFGRSGRGRIEYSAYFVHGVLKELHCIEQRKPGEGE